MQKDLVIATGEVRHVTRAVNPATHRIYYIQKHSKIIDFLTFKNLQKVETGLGVILAALLGVWDYGNSPDFERNVWAQHLFLRIHFRNHFFDVYGTFMFQNFYRSPLLDYRIFTWEMFRPKLISHESIEKRFQLRLRLLWFCSMRYT